MKKDACCCAEPHTPDHLCLLLTARAGHGRLPPSPSPSPRCSGVLYNASIVPCPASLAVINMGVTEARVEALFSEFVQLRCAACARLSLLPCLPRAPGCLLPPGRTLRRAAAAGAHHLERLEAAARQDLLSVVQSKLDATKHLMSALPLHAARTRASRLSTPTSWAAWWAATMTTTMPARARAAARAAPRPRARRVRQGGACGGMGDAWRVWPLRVCWRARPAQPPSRPAGGKAGGAKGGGAKVAPRKRAAAPKAKGGVKKAGAKPRAKPKPKPKAAAAGKKK